MHELLASLIGCKTICVSQTCKLTVFVVHWRRFFLNSTRHIERIRGVISGNRRYINLHLNLNSLAQNAASLYEKDFAVYIKSITSATITSSSRVRVMNHNWSATKQRLHLQSVAEISYTITDIVWHFQDVQLNAVRAELSDLLSKSSETQRQLDESVQHVQQLKDQNALLKAQKGNHWPVLTVYSWENIVLLGCLK